MVERAAAADALEKDTAMQTGDQRSSALFHSRTAAETATGQAKRQLIGEEDERLSEHDEHGSTAEIAGGAPTPDLKGNVLRNRGAQTEPAAFVVNGVQAAGLLPSPSGPQPVGLQARDLDHAKELTEQRRDAPRGNLRARDELSEEVVAGLDAPTLRAVATTRGYKDFPRLGNEGTRREFLARQSKDQNFSRPEPTAEPEAA